MKLNHKTKQLPHSLPDHDLTITTVFNEVGRQTLTITYCQGYVQSLSPMCCTLADVAELVAYAQNLPKEGA